MKTTLGLVGIGLVGTALAENLLRADHKVLGFDINADRLQTLETLGGEATHSAAEVGARCETVILSLHDSESVRQALMGANGLLSDGNVVRRIIDTTTGDPDQTIALWHELSASGISYLDATISGSSDQVRRREGVFLVGGTRSHYDSCRDIIAELAEIHHYVGPSGSGAKTKLASNLILGLNRLALAEGLVFAERLGLDLSAFLSVLRGTPAYSAAVDVKGEKMLVGDFTPQSKISQHRKDLDIILRYSGKQGQPLPLAETHHKILRLAEEAGLADADTSAVIQQLRQMRGD